MVWKMKLRAGALQFTIFIGAVVALLLLGVVLLMYTHRFFLQQSQTIVENIRIVDSGVRYAGHLSVSADTINLPLDDATGQQLVDVHLSHWGIFEKVFVRATHRKKQFTKCGLLGTTIKTIDRPVVYLQETHKPLVVVGDTEIKGVCYLPQQGIRPGNIAGNSYYGSQLAYGNVRTSTSELPKLKYDLKQVLNDYLYTYQPSASENALPINNPKAVNSFTDLVKGYYSPKTVILEHTSLYGNIIIRSQEKIIIKNTANLHDVILAAPVIIIEDGVKGNFQAIASVSIKVGKDCILDYPSALVLLEMEQVSNPTIINADFNKISIDKNTRVKGSICYLKTRAETGYLPNIFINKQSLVQGEIYCEGNLEFRGALVGTVFTNQFITNEGGTSFINHLYNVSLNSSDLPETFAGILLENESKSVMKWLY